MLWQQDGRATASRPRHGGRARLALHRGHRGGVRGHMGIQPVDFGSLRTPGANALPWSVLAIVFYLAETCVVHLQFRKQAHTLSASRSASIRPVLRLAGRAAGGAGRRRGCRDLVHRRQKAGQVLVQPRRGLALPGIGLLVFRSLVGRGSIGPAGMGGCASRSRGGAHRRRLAGDVRDRGCRGAPGRAPAAEDVGDVARRRAVGQLSRATRGRTGHEGAGGAAAGGASVARVRGRVPSATCSSVSNASTSSSSTSRCAQPRAHPSSGSRSVSCWSRPGGSCVPSTPRSSSCRRTPVSRRCAARAARQARC